MTCLAIDRQNESSATSCDMFWGITAVLLIRNMLIAVYIWNVKNLDRIKDTSIEYSGLSIYNVQTVFVLNLIVSRMKRN